MSTTIYTKTYAQPSMSNVVISLGGSGGTSSGVIHNSGYNNGTTWTSHGRTWAAPELKSNTIKVNGDAEFSGNITWQGRDMREWFATIESRLSILQPNPELEENYDKLKKLGDQYRALEKQLLEQQRTFDILKKSLD